MRVGPRRGPEVLLCSPMPGFGVRGAWPHAGDREETLGKERAEKRDSTFGDLSEEKRKEEEQCSGVLAPLLISGFSRNGVCRSRRREGKGLG